MRWLVLLGLVGCSGSARPEQARYGLVPTGLATCPARFGSDPAARCAKELTCSYPEGTCSCESACQGTDDGSEPVLEWTCRKLPAGCPADPDRNPACDSPGMTCEYFRHSTCGGTTAVCIDGRWQFQHVPKVGGAR